MRTLARAVAPTALYRAMLAGLVLASVLVWEVLLGAMGMTSTADRVAVAMVAAVLAMPGYGLFRLVSRPTGAWRCQATPTLPWARGLLGWGLVVAQCWLSGLILGMAILRWAVGLPDAGHGLWTALVALTLIWGVPLLIAVATEVDPSTPNEHT